MSSIFATLGVLVPPWKHKKLRLSFLSHSIRNPAVFHYKISSCLRNDSVPVPGQIPLRYYSPGETSGLEVDVQPRNISSGTPKFRSWFGPNGQYIRELPCPSCRGRGYTLCTECKIEKPKLDCPQCNGKGLKTCHQCLGDCVIWEESIDERPWEKARSISPFKVKEDDEVDNLDLKLKARKKSKRVYQSPSPEIGLKISKSLKSLNAKTGLFTNRMKIIHRDPILHAQRVAAIKKTKGAAAARKRASEAMKAFFRDPANRLKRSIAMKGVKFYCRHCGREGHRKHNCPELESRDRQFRCGICGEKGHNRRTCGKRSTDAKSVVPRPKSGLCGAKGHNRRTCGKSTIANVVGTSHSHGERPRQNVGTLRRYSCRLCQGEGHNSRTCPGRTATPLRGNPKSETANR